MFKEFANHIAWTDSIQYEQGYAGFIGYQHKTLTDKARILWVLGPNFKNEYDAEISANNMLEHIIAIDRFGRITYSDGVML